MHAGRRAVSCGTHPDQFRRHHDRRRMRPDREYCLQRHAVLPRGASWRAEFDKSPSLNNNKRRRPVRSMNELDGWPSREGNPMEEHPQAALVSAGSAASGRVPRRQRVDHFEPIENFAGSPLLRSRSARVRLRIERDLRDPDLDPAKLTARLRISPRYLWQMFAASNESVAAYILRRRLEECARELADPERRRTSITEIAFSWGFSSASHFTRSFREHYGMSPRQYRSCAGSLGLMAEPAGNDAAAGQ